MDLETLDWDPAIADELGIPMAMLPDIRGSSEPYGTGVGDLDGVPIAGILGDQQAALFGQACFEAGEAKCTYGTGAFMLMHTGITPVTSTHGLITTVAARLGGRGTPATYALEGSVAVAGSLVQWLRDDLGLIDAADEVEALARSVPDSGDVVIVPAFSGLFAPHWRPDARGVIAGLTRFTSKAHIARAALEATAYQVADLGAAMAADLGVATPRRAAGRRRDDPQRAADADPGGHPGSVVVAPPIAEVSALGAAYAAGLAVGFWRDLDELRSMAVAPRRWEPRMSERDRAAGLARWHKGVERSLGWVDPARGAGAGPREPPLGAVMRTQCRLRLGWSRTRTPRTRTSHDIDPSPLRHAPQPRHGAVARPGAGGLRASPPWPAGPDRPAERLAAGRHRVVGLEAVRRLARERRDLARQRHHRQRPGPRAGRGRARGGRPPHRPTGVDCGSPAARPARSASTTRAAVALLKTYQFTGTGFLNDLDISRNRVVVTDSMNAQVGIIPLGRHGRLRGSSAARLLPLKGDYAHQPGFNINGIAARGGYLILVQSNTGFLFRLNPSTGNTKRIDTDGYLVGNGDGLELVGRTLYVVRNQLNTVAVLRLSRNLLHARLLGEIHRDPPILNVPTTATVTLGKLYVVNARFGVTAGADHPVLDHAAAAATRPDALTSNKAA